jgi:hypothetical protein
MYVAATFGASRWKYTGDTGSSASGTSLVTYCQGPPKRCHCPARAVPRIFVSGVPAGSSKKPLVAYWKVLRNVDDLLAGSLETWPVPTRRPIATTQKLQFHLSAHRHLHGRSPEGS